MGVKNLDRIDGVLITVFVHVVSTVNLSIGTLPDQLQLFESVKAFKCLGKLARCWNPIPKEGLFLRPYVAEQSLS